MQRASLLFLLVLAAFGQTRSRKADYACFWRTLR
jgi:hypothetical protein